MAFILWISTAVPTARPARSNGIPVTAGTSGAIADTGGLNKLGNDVLVLTGANTYAGPTVVSNGALVVNGSLLGGGPVTVAGGALHGSGVITGPVTVQADACLCPDGLVVANIGSSGIDGVDMTVSNTLWLAGTAWMGINRTNTHNSDRVIGISTVTYGGTLTMTNRGPALQAGDSFKLFDASNYVGSFAAISPATPGIGIVWDMSYLPVDGTLRIASASGGQSSQTVTLQPGYNFVSCQVVGSPNNDVNNTNFLQVPASLSENLDPPSSGTNAMLQVWTGAGLTTYYYFTAADATAWEGDTYPAGWYDMVGNPAPDVIWNPGRGMIIDNKSGVPATLTLIGTPPSLHSRLRIVSLTAF